MTGGFGEDALLTGADIEQTISNPGKTQDDPSDKVSIKIGIDLYRTGLSEQTLLRQIYWYKQQLNKVKQNERGEYEVY